MHYPINALSSESNSVFHGKRSCLRKRHTPTVGMPYPAAFFKIIKIYCNARDPGVKQVKIN